MPGQGERRAAFSPDGNWIAYSSGTEGQQPEIYVRPFPEPGRTRQISNEGGDMPVWAQDGRELWYSTFPGRQWIVPITLGDTLQAGVPEQTLSQAAPGRG